MESRWKGSYLHSDGTQRSNNDGYALVEHFGPRSKVTVSGYGEGDVAWSGTTGEGSFRVTGGETHRMRVHSSSPGDFDYVIEDEEGNIVARGKLSQRTG